MTTAIAQMKARLLVVFLKALYLKHVVFKEGVRGHLSESYWRLSTPFRPPWFTAGRMSRLSSRFTWSTLNVEARGENLSENLLAKSEEIFHSRRGRVGAASRNCEG